MTTKFVGFSALIFYVLCWFSHQQTDVLHYIGISLPWLSLLAGIAVHIFTKTKEDNTGTYWAYSYIILTVAYVVAVSLMSGSIWHQVPHMATCVTFLAYFALERLEKKR